MVKKFDEFKTDPKLQEYYDEYGRSIQEQIYDSFKDGDSLTEQFNEYHHKGFMSLQVPDSRFSSEKKLGIFISTGKDDSLNFKVTPVSSRDSKIFKDPSAKYAATRSPFKGKKNVKIESISDYLNNTGLTYDDIVNDPMYFSEKLGVTLEKQLNKTGFKDIHQTFTEQDVEDRHVLSKAANWYRTYEELKNSKQKMPDMKKDLAENLKARSLVNDQKHIAWFSNMINGDYDIHNPNLGNVSFDPTISLEDRMIALQNSIDHYDKQLDDIKKIQVKEKLTGKVDMTKEINVDSFSYVFNKNLDANLPVNRFDSAMQELQNPKKSKKEKYKQTNEKVDKSKYSELYVHSAKGMTYKKGDKMVSAVKVKMATRPDVHKVNVRMQEQVIPVTAYNKLLKLNHKDPVPRDKNIWKYRVQSGLDQNGDTLLVSGKLFASKNDKGAKLNFASMEKTDHPQFDLNSIKKTKKLVKTHDNDGPDY